MEREWVWHAAGWKEAESESEIDIVDCCCFCRCYSRGSADDDEIAMEGNRVSRSDETEGPGTDAAGV